MSDQHTIQSASNGVPTTDRSGVTVVGAGVSGLTCALLLLEDGYAVDVITRDDTLQTTSAVAAASWFPFLVEPADRVAVWAAESFTWFKDLATTAGSDAGIRMRSAEELLPEAEPPPLWSTVLETFEQDEPADLPAPYTTRRRMTIPVIEMPIYLNYLRQRIAALGGSITRGDIADLQALATKARVVVNCTGLGARTLCNDDQMHPIRGQIVSVKAPMVDTVRIFDRPDTGPGYIIPRSADCILGGTAAPHSDDLTVNHEQTAEIIAKCRVHDPGLAAVEADRVVVGLRPARTEVRLEAEELPNGGTVIHNYGHGGGGVTLSYGCAREVRTLVRSVLAPA